MNTKVTLPSALSMLFSLFFILASGIAHAQGSGNPLNANGSFEDTETGVVTDLVGGIEGWVLEIGSGIGTDPEFAVVDDVAYEGDQSLRVTVNEAGANAWDIQAVGDSIEVVPGATYVYSVWARVGSGEGTAAFTVGNYDFDEYFALRDNITLTEEWQEFSGEFTVSDDATVIRAPIHFSFAENVGNAVYIDNLSIAEEGGGEPTDPNLNTNGSLEETEVGVITDLSGGVEGWVFFIDDGGAEFAVVDDVAYEGDQSLRVTVNEAGANAWDIQAVGDAVPVLPGETYVYSIWARAEAAGGTANFTVGNYDFEEYDRVDDVTLTEEWQEITMEFTITDEETLIRAPIHFSFAENVSNAVYIDNLSIVEEGGGGEEPDGPPLAAGLDKFLGNVYSASQVEHFEHYWNQVTPENAGKWGSVESTRDVMNWGGLDAAFDLAEQNGFPVRFHVLVWGNQQPDWIASLPQDEQLVEIQEWFQAVADRYGDRIDYLEVVNEPLHDPPDGPGDGGYIEALGGTGETGWDWVVTAFQMARDIFPEDVRLMINDYNILNNPINAQDYYEIVELLQADGLIDGIGVQGHAFSTRVPATTLTNTLDLLATTGLPIQVTEMDVDGNPNVDPDLTEAKSDQNQLEDMQRIFPVLWEHPAVEGITMWGWRPGLWRTAEEAYLVRTDGEERPALVWLREYLEAYATPAEPSAEALASARLLGNYPNPFTPSTQIKYVIAESAEVTLEVYDVLGRQVRTLVAARQAPGEYVVRFDADGLASGVYLYRLQAGPSVDTRRMTLLD